MKKLITCIVLFITAAFAADSRLISDLIKKTITIPAEKILVDEVVNEVIDVVITDYNNDYEKPKFDSTFYYMRAATFSQEPLSEVMNNTSEGYWTVRALVITKLKGYLHKGTTLSDTYKNSFRDVVRAKLSTLKPEVKAKIKAKLISAYGLFAMMKTKSIKEAFITFRNAEQKCTSQPSHLLILGKNLSEKELVAQIEAGALNEDQTVDDAEGSFTRLFDDPHLAKFAGRRAVEGGDDLIDKYLAVIEMMIEDVK